MSDNGWKNINELRKVDANYSGMRYSVEYAEEAGVLPYRYCERFGEIHSVGICEEIELCIDDKEVRFRECEIAHKDRSAKIMFDTQFGVFQNDNRGEFGGSMLSPAGICVHGNFREVVNHKKRVYAIDSMNHLGLVHFRLLEFAGAKRYREIYSTINDLKDLFHRECLQYGALFDDEDALYFVISGFVVDKEDEYIGHSKLLRVYNSKVEEIYSVNESFCWINSLVVILNKAYVSMDKMVVCIDLEAGSLEYLTNLSENAELDLLIIEEKELRGNG